MNPASITHSVTYENFHVVSIVCREVWAFLQSENVWNEYDYSEYMEHCKKLLKSEIRTIAGFETPKKNIYKLFDEVLADDYYRIVLSYEKRNDHILNGLKKENIKE